MDTAIASDALPTYRKRDSLWFAGIEEKISIFNIPMHYWHPAWNCVALVNRAVL